MDADGNALRRNYWVELAIFGGMWLVIMLVQWFGFRVVNTLAIDSVLTAWLVFSLAKNLNSVPPADPSRGMLPSRAHQWLAWSGLFGISVIAVVLFAGIDVDRWLVLLVGLMYLVHVPTYFQRQADRRRDMLNNTMDAIRAVRPFEGYTTAEKPASLLLEPSFIGSISSEQQARLLLGSSFIESVNPDNKIVVRALLKELESLLK